MALTVERSGVASEGPWPRCRGDTPTVSAARRDPAGAQLLPDQRPPQPGASPQQDIANFRGLARLLPVMVTLVPYWMVYFQVRARPWLRNGPGPRPVSSRLGSSWGLQSQQPAGP